SATCGFASNARGRSLLTKLNHVGREALRCVRAVSLPQKPRHDIPTLPDVRDDGNGLPVVAGQHTNHDRMAFWLKGDSISDLELEHFAVRAHLVQEPQALDNPIVQVDEFRLGELVDVDLHVRSHGRPSPLWLLPNAPITRGGRERWIQIRSIVGRSPSGAAAVRRPSFSPISSALMPTPTSLRQNLGGV